MKFIKKNLKLIIICVIVVFLFVMGIIINLPGRDVVSNEVKKKTEQKIVINVKGEVNKENTYEVDKGIYLFKLIELAGGFSDYADVSNVNLIDKISSSCDVIINRSDKARNNEILIKDYHKTSSYHYFYISGDNTIYIFDDGIYFEEIYFILNMNESSFDYFTEDTYVNKKTIKGLVNINTGSLEELMTLNGIGKGIATKIIEYRNKNGMFKTIDEIKNVSGIGNSIYEKIKDYICV